MSFSFAAAGHKEHVRRALRAQVELHKSWANNNTAHEEAALDLIEKHLDASAYNGGVIVEASGHHDASGGTLNLSIKPVYLPAGVDEPAAPHEHAEAADPEGAGE